jgi:uncharacterized protein with PIN domain
MARQGPEVIFERRYECRLEGDFLVWVEAKQKVSGIKSRGEFLKRQLAAQDFESWTQLSQRMAEVGQAMNALRAQLEVHPCPQCHASIEAASDQAIRTMRAVYRAIPKRKVE